MLNVHAFQIVAFRIVIDLWQLSLTRLVLSNSQAELLLETIADFS